MSISLAPRQALLLGLDPAWSPSFSLGPTQVRGV